MIIHTQRQLIDPLKQLNSFNSDSLQYFLSYFNRKIPDLYRTSPARVLRVIQVL